MSIHTLITPGLSICTYLVVDDLSKKAAVIDPTRNIDDLLRLLKELDANLCYIIETHVHADFISGARELKSRLDNKPLIICSAAGGDDWTPFYANQAMKPNDILALGNLELEAIHTPGHTWEHLAFLLKDQSKPAALFTGDLLFAGSVGRPDLLGSTDCDPLTEQLYHSLFTVLAPLPDALPIYPAHGAGSLCGKGITGDRTTTLEKERLTNPYLKLQPFSEWKQQLLKDMPPVPQYFKTVKALNLLGNVLMPENHPGEVGQEDLHHWDFKNYFLADIRNPEEFSQAHFKTSINIPLGPAFLSWADDLIDAEAKILLIAKSHHDALKAIKSLHLIGIDNIKGFILAEKAPLDSSLPLMDVQELVKNLSNMYVIDVRTDAEWAQGHIPQALHIEMHALAKNLKGFSKNKPLAFICGSGYRSSIAASIAQNAGFNVCSVKGGMQAWNQAGLPTKK